jgi:hypothetical protein
MRTWEHIKLVEKKYFHENMGTYKIGGVSHAQRPRVFFGWGRSLKIHLENKKGVVEVCKVPLST